MNCTRLCMYCRKHWPQELVSHTSSMREVYLKRRVAVQQFKFVDPLRADLVVPDAKPFDHIILDNNDIIFSQVINSIYLVFNCLDIFSGTWFVYIVAQVFNIAGFYSLGFLDTKGEY